MALSAFTTELTGITEEHMKNAKSFADSIDEILDFIGDSILVAHNATFDYNFLNDELARIGRPPIMNPVIDTLDLARMPVPMAFDTMRMLLTVPIMMRRFLRRPI